MKKYIKNEHDLKENEITEVVKRVKVLLINSKNEIMLGFSNNNYQFPGGHVEDGEKLIETVNREIEEETGIKLNAEGYEPFACLSGYWKDWPEAGKNRKTEIYYFEIPCDLKPNLSNTNYTEEEISRNFRLKYIPLDKLEEELNNNINEFGDEEGIVKEMIGLYEIYKEMKKNDEESSVNVI